MMKVADLQQFINGLAQPMRSAGASQKVIDDLTAMSLGLERFKERTIGEFNDFLRMASDYVADGTLPDAGRRSSSRKPSSPKAPAMSVDDAAQRIMALNERSTVDATLDHAAIEAEVNMLEPMTVPQLKQLAEQVLMSVPPNMRTKQDLLKAFSTGIRERKLASERPLNMQTAGQPHQMPVGASDLGDA
jgi:hypothetical protein